MPRVRSDIANKNIPDQIIGNSGIGGSQEPSATYNPASSSPSLPSGEQSPASPPSSENEWDSIITEFSYLTEKMLEKSVEIKKRLEVKGIMTTNEMVLSTLEDLTENFIRDRLQQNNSWKTHYEELYKQKFDIAMQDANLKVQQILGQANQILESKGVEERLVM